MVPFNSALKRYYRGLASPGSTTVDKKANAGPEGGGVKTFTLSVPDDYAVLRQPFCTAYYISLARGCRPPVPPVFSSSVFPPLPSQPPLSHSPFPCGFPYFTTIVPSMFFRHPSPYFFLILRLCVSRFNAAGSATLMVYGGGGVRYYLWPNPELLPSNHVLSSHPAAPSSLVVPLLMVGLLLRGKPTLTSNPVTLTPQWCYSIGVGSIGPLPSNLILRGNPLLASAPPTLIPEWCYFIVGGSVGPLSPTHPFSSWRLHPLKFPTVTPHFPCPQLPC